MPLSYKVWLRWLVFGYCRQVAGVFEAKQWSHIDCHLQEKLGVHAAEAEDFLTAAKFFAGTLACPASHPNRQRGLLQQFLSTLRQLSPEEVESNPSVPPSKI